MLFEVLAMCWTRCATLRWEVRGGRIRSGQDCPLSATAKLKGAQLGPLAGKFLGLTPEETQAVTASVDGRRDNPYYSQALRETFLAMCRLPLDS